MNHMFKPAVSALAGMATAVFEIVAPMFVLSAAFVIADAFTAYRLQRRLAASGKMPWSEAKFSSARFGKILQTLGKIFCLILLAAMADHLVLNPLGIGMVKFVAGAICFWQAISLLENEASHNEAKWAVHARRFLIDKARRYINDKC